MASGLPDLGAISPDGPPDRGACPFREGGCREGIKTPPVIRGTRYFKPLSFWHSKLPCEKERSVSVGFSPFNLHPLRRGTRRLVIGVTGYDIIDVMNTV